uniref:Putative F-box protein n=1 Tax=Noccaea caerulescens TaxID=107243 RepID=A0A1J3FHI9_NOCCA
MEIEKHHDRDTSNSKSWSELPPELLDLVFKRLTMADFQRAKSVCSSWLSSSRQSVPRNNNQMIPWLILFPKDVENNPCLLFNPEEKDKLYRTRREEADLGSEFAKSFCIATCGNWLLMRDPLFTLYIVNLFTHEIIRLPPVETQLGTMKIERMRDDGDLEFRVTCDSGKVYKHKKGSLRLQSSLLWIDEKTRDYIVVWGLVERHCCVVYCKNGDTSWNQIPETLDCCDMVYKDSKLYFLSSSCGFIIFDMMIPFPFPPQVTFQCSVYVCKNRCRCSEYVERDRCRHGYRQSVAATMIVVTVTGQVLKVEKISGIHSRTWSFRVYKVYSSGSVEKIDSLGDEALLLDQGITVLANDTNGLVRNSIYFSYPCADTIFCVFNLEEQKMELLHRFDSSSSSSVDQFSRGRWFLPSFTQPSC